MQIKGIEFNVNAASGSLGFFGEGYWYHQIFKWIIPFFKKTTENMVFVSKTSTWDFQIGNLSLKGDYTPRYLMPSCIKVYPFQGMMLNAVNLSGPGFKKLMATGKWQNLKREALGISFMPVGKTLEEMMWETRSFRDAIIEAIKQSAFRSPIWIQVNLSCPNTDQDQKVLIDSATDILEILDSLRTEYGLVIDLKVNLLMPNAVIKRLWELNLCDLMTISNTIKFGTPVLGIEWNRLFWWRRTSPLASLGGGGLSGKPLFDVLCHKISSLRQENIRRGSVALRLKASGGICSVNRIKVIRAYGADAIEFATAISLRPWNVPGMVKAAKKLFSD